MKACNKNSLDKINEIELSYSRYLKNNDFEKIYNELWAKTDYNYLEYLDGADMKFHVLGRDSFEKGYEDNLSYLFEHSRYGSQAYLSLKVQVIYPRDGLFLTNNCTSDYLVLKLQNGNLRISSSSLLPLGGDIELGNYRWMDESYYKTQLQELTEGKIYRYECFPKINF